MEDPLLLQFLTDHEVDLVVLDLLLGFYKSTYVHIDIYIYIYIYIHV